MPPFPPSRRAVIRRQQAGFRADGNGFACCNRRSARCLRAPIIGNGLVTVHVAVAGAGRQLPAHAAGRHADKVVVAWRAVDDLAGVEVFALWIFHEGLSRAARPHCRPSPWRRAPCSCRGRSRRSRNTSPSCRRRTRPCCPSSCRSCPRQPARKSSPWYPCRFARPP